MKKILIIQNSLKTVGIFRLHYIEELLSSGCYVYVVAPLDCRQTERQLEDKGVKVKGPVPGNSFIVAFLMNFYILHILLRNFRCKIQCHFVSTIVFSYPILIFNCWRTLLVVEGLGSFFTDRPWMCNLLKIMITALPFKRIFMNEDEKRLLGRQSDLVLGGIGIDLKKYQPIMPNSREQTRDIFRLLYVGRLLKDKGVLDCFDVLKQCLDKGLNTELHIFGSIYHSNPSSLTISEVNFLKTVFNGRVFFHGFSSQLYLELPKYDLLLLPSSREGFPVVVMEASAVGIPVVVYSVPGSLDSVNHGVNGYIVDKNDTYAISNIISMLISDEIIFSSRSARKYAEENFDVYAKNSTIMSYHVS